MKSPRELFHDNQELHSWLRPIVNHPHWSAVCVYARASIMDSEPTPQILEGCKMFEKTFLALAEPDEQLPHFPRSGLHHDLEPKAVPPPKLRPPKTITPKKPK